jgi:putative ABC transport system ATP-binding protein
MISIRSVSKTFRSPSGELLRVLQDVSLEIPAGASVAIQGPSGSGKSTLLGLVAGLDQPTSGEVVVNEQSISSLSELALSRFRAKNLGFVFQAYHLLPHFSALQNIVIAAEIAGLPSAEAKALEALTRVGLQDRAEHLPAQLSGGECQRVALARAIVARPPILLCDEPTGSLDPVNADRVFELLLELQQDLGATLVLVTHDVQLASRMGLHLTLERGRVVAGVA